jgi:SagB-type dehydrogenase family enzyme
MDFRTAPSAGALYPLEVYIVAGNVSGLPAGVYKYKHKGHELLRISAGDKRKELCRAALGQEAIKDAGAVMVFTVVYERTTVKYGERGKRYVYMETGHAAQNVYLEAESLNLGTVAIGAFTDSEVKKVLNLPEKEEPLYLMPIGKK